MIVKKLLKSFSEEEKNVFVRYCQSPFSNIRPQAVELFDLLRESPADSFDSESLWSRISSCDRPYNDATFRKIRSNLYQEMGRFLSFRSYEKRMDGELDFLEETFKRGLWPLWKREYRRLGDQWNGSSLPGALHHYQNSRLAYAGFGGAVHVPDIDSRQSFHKMEESMDRFYLAWKLRMVVNRLVYSGIYDEEMDRSAERLIGSGLVDRHMDDPLISVYFRLYNLYAGGKEHLFSQLVKSLDCLGDTAADERYEIGGHVLNYAIRKADQGSHEYMKAAFAICKKLLENGDFFLGKQVTGMRYLSMIRYGLAMGKRKFVKSFMRKFGENLAGNDSEDYHDLACSTLHFYEGRLQEALDCLPEAERKNIFLDLNVRILRFMILFEMQADCAENCLHSLKMKLFRLGKQEILSPEYKELYRRVSLVMGRLLRADPDTDVQSIIFEASDLPAEIGTWVAKMVFRRK